MIPLYEELALYAAYVCCKAGCGGVNVGGRAGPRAGGAGELVG